MVHRPVSLQMELDAARQALEEAADRSELLIGAVRCVAVCLMCEAPKPCVRIGSR